MQAPDGVNVVTAVAEAMEPKSQSRCWYCCRWGQDQAADGDAEHVKVEVWPVTGKVLSGKRGGRHLDLPSESGGKVRERGIGKVTGQPSERRGRESTPQG